LTIAAAIHDGLRKSVVIDERSAAFIALGIGKATGKPALLICTSGTAGANYMPAVIEARESGVPLVVLTADRPPNQRGIGSSQTIDQLKLYGGQEVFFHEAGEPRIDDTDLDRLAYLARQAVQESVRLGGASHINLPFRKPLEPSGRDIEEQADLNRKQLAGHRIPDSGTGHNTVHLSSAASSLLNSADRPLIVAGPANPHHALQNIFETVAGKLNAPVIQEPGSSIEPDGSRSINRYEQLLRIEKFTENMTPDLVIRFGDQPFTKSLLNAFQKWHKERIPFLHFTARHPTQDQAMSISETVVCSPADRLDTTSLHSSNESENWLTGWQEAEKSAETVLEQTLENEKLFSDGHVFRYVSGQVPEDWNVMLSNSFIPRDMALFGGPEKHQFVNRGTAGIDGILSTAIGIHQSSGRATLCVLGDVAFLHDSNALLSLKNIERPFVIVIVNNGGGNIFRMLPVHQHSDFYTQYFETPQNVGFENLARAHGLDYIYSDTLNDLQHLDLKTIDGVRIVECKTDSKTSMQIRQQLWNMGSLSDV
jgi:2-succinyl-5-enolpyruvyl-6-hydroxy-3-cyclohexene-1-carboxylate synthase